MMTLVQANMLMKWFAARRGLVTGITHVFIPVGFSMAPIAFNASIGACQAVLVVLAVSGLWTEKPDSPPEQRGT